MTVRPHVVDNNVVLLPIFSWYLLGVATWDRVRLRCRSLIPQPNPEMLGFAETRP